LRNALVEFETTVAAMEAIVEAGGLELTAAET
jgi:hypothetical protein